MEGWKKKLLIAVIALWFESDIYRIIRLKDEFLMVLIKLRLGFLVTELS